MEDQKDYSYDNTHAENTKITIDKVLGQQTVSKRVRKTAEDKRKINFCKFIDNLIIAEEKNVTMLEVFDVDMTKYSNTYIESLESLMSVFFNKEQIEMIYFYLYDRYASDGSVMGITDAAGNVVPLDNSGQLWEVLKTMK